MGELMMVLSNVPAVLCLLIGVALVIVEMFIPGFGVPGVVGIALLVVGTILGATTVAQGLAIIGVVLLILIIALPFCLRSLAKGRLDKSKMVLNTVSVSGGDNPFADLLGREGVCGTMLRPAGIVLFGDDRVNVVSAGDFIKEGARVRVERVEGNRIVVRQVDLEHT